MTLPFPRADWWRVAAREVWLPTAEEMAALDRHAIESGSIPERALIENAGRAVARLIHDRDPDGRVLVLAGSGHNGADALVAGRTLFAWGRDVRFMQCGSRAPSPDVLAGWDLTLDETDALDADLASADVVIDGLLGTGVETAPRPPQAEIIERVNASNATVVAVDGPSGVDFTTGGVAGAAIRADLTVTFGWPKLGLLRFPARARCGDLLSVEIGFPPPSSAPAARAVTAAWAAQLLGDRRSDMHKGDAGYLAILGGQPGMAGAAVLAARAAIRTGAGIVRVISAPENREVLQSAVPEAVFVDWSDESAVSESCAWAHAVAIGPGLGTGSERTALIARALGNGPGPAVIDADGLNALAESPDDLAVGPACLLTPHPGEMSRLLEMPIAQVKEDPVGAARSLSGSTGATVLLKGAPSWIASPSGELRVSTLLSSGFASGGMGDVLAGVSGAYQAAQLTAADAATAAIAVTALAVLAEVDGVGGSSADVPDALPAAREALHRAAPGAWAGVQIALASASNQSERTDDGSETT